MTVHKFKGGIHSAVSLQDGCFGTTTVMRIASMFVPHNIFQVRAPRSFLSVDLFLFPAVCGLPQTVYGRTARGDVSQESCLSTALLCSKRTQLMTTGC